jgi:hypothetical protein
MMREPEATRHVPIAAGSKLINDVLDLAKIESGIVA